MAAAGVLVAGLSFARFADGADPPVFSPIVEEHRLANGLRVVLAPDDALSDVSVVVRYEAGHGDDPDGKEGLAHVTEHVLFGAFRRGAQEMAAAYQPGADVRWFPQASVALLGGYLESRRVIAATRVMLSSVRALRDHGPELEALARAKARTKADVQDAVSNNERVAASLQVVGGEAHPLDPCEAMARIDAVAPDDVRAAMRQYFAEKRLGVLVVAREDQLDAWPADLDMGKVQRRDWLAEDMP